MLINNNNLNCIIFNTNCLVLKFKLIQLSFNNVKQLQLKIVKLII